MTTLGIDRNGLEILGPEECLRLLRTAHVGRIGITVGALPSILPVNFRVLDRRIVFRTAAGTKLGAATCNAVVAFEADSIDALSHTGWSVLVIGVAREVTEPAELAEVNAAAVPRWAPAGQDRFVAVSIEMVSGRRLSAEAAVCR